MSEINFKRNTFNIRLPRFDTVNNIEIIEADINEWLEFNSNIIEFYAFIYHYEKDFKHYHLHIKTKKLYESKSIINNLARFFMININMIECKVCINVSASCRYLLHLDNKEKKQYDFDNLYTNDSQKFIDIINNSDYEYTSLNFNMLFEIVLSSNSLIEVYKRVGLANAQKYRYVIKDMFEQRNKL